MVKHRSIGLCLLLHLLTCGFYGFFWFISLTDDTNEVTETGGTSGFTSLLLVILTCGIYQYYWAYKLGEKLDYSRAKNGAPHGNLALVFLALSIFSISGYGFGLVVYCIAQNELNKYVPA